MTNAIMATALILVLAFIWLALRTPKVLKISRSKIIRTSPEHIFPYINKPKLINEWSPFLTEDPSIKISYGNIDEGENATWSWDGKRAGAGTATIVKSEKNQKVELRLDFKKPFFVTNYGSYSIAEKEGAVEVTWTVNEGALIPRVLSHFIDLEKVIGQVFDKGLAKLDAIARTL